MLTRILARGPVIHALILASLALPGYASADQGAATWPPGLAGPLPAGPKRRFAGVEVEQPTATETIIRFAGSGVRITAPSTPGERYTFYIESPRTPDQRVLCIAATLGVQITRFASIDPSQPVLVVHIKRVADPAHASSTPSPLAAGREDDIQVHAADATNAALDLDQSSVEILAERPAARFAYWIDDAWSGRDYRERVVHIAAMPGVRVRHRDPRAPAAEQPATAEDRAAARIADTHKQHMGSFDRVLVPHLVRVQDPALLPVQGQAFDSRAFLGIESAWNASNPSRAGPATLRALVGRASVVIEHPDSGHRLILRARNSELGARFAYQLVGHLQGKSALAEIRAVVSADTHVQVIKSSERQADASADFVRGRVSLHLVELADPDKIPAQGSPLDMAHWKGQGRARAPDVVYRAETAETEVATAVADILVSLVPVVGDSADASELVAALASDRDRWNRPVTARDKWLMAAGTLAPFVGASMLRGGARAAGELTRVAHTLGRDPVSMLETLSSVSPTLNGADTAVLRRFEDALEHGRQFDAADVSRLRQILDSTVVVERPPGGFSVPVLPGAVSREAGDLQKTGALSKSALAGMSGEEILALDVIRQGLPESTFSAELVHLLTSERGAHKSPLWAMHQARVTPDDIRALGITERSSARNAYDILRAGRDTPTGHIPGYHELIGARIHDWSEFRRVADALSSQQAGHIFEHWLRAHAGHWLGDLRRLRFDKSTYKKMSKTRTADVWDQYEIRSNSVGEIWEFKYTKERIDRKQLDDYESLLDQTAPDGAQVLTVNYVFSSIEGVAKNEERFRRARARVFYIDDTGVMQRYLTR